MLVNVPPDSVNVVPLLAMPFNVIRPALLAVVLPYTSDVFTSNAAAVVTNSKDELVGNVDEKTARLLVPAIAPMVLSMLVFNAVMLTSAVRNLVRPCITLPKPMPVPSITRLLPVNTCVSL